MLGFSKFAMAKTAYSILPVSAGDWYFVVTNREITAAAF